MRKSIIVVFSVIFLYMVFSVSKTLVNTLRVERQIKVLGEKVEEMVVEKERLIDLYEEVQEVDYVEKQARDKLNFVNPGENVVVISDPPVEDEKDLVRVNSNLPIKDQWQLLILGGVDSLIKNDN